MLDTTTGFGTRARAPMLDPALLPRAIGDAFRKLNPLTLARNPVIFVTEVVSVLVTLLAARAALSGQP